VLHQNVTCVKESTFASSMIAQ